MMVLRCILCSLLASILMTVMIHAQEDMAPIVSPENSTVAPASRQPSDAGAKKKVIYREKSYFEFEDTLINGNLRSPDGSFIFRKGQSTFSSALNLRRSFIPELKQSGDDSR